MSHKVHVTVYFRNERAIREAIGDEPSSKRREHIRTCTSLPPDYFEASPYFDFMMSEYPNAIDAPMTICERIFNRLKVVDNANPLVRVDENRERLKKAGVVIRPMAIGDFIQLNSRYYRIVSSGVDSLDALLNHNRSVSPYAIELFNEPTTFEFRYTLCDTMGDARSTRAVDAGFTYDIDIHGRIGYIRWELARVTVCRCPALVHELTDAERREIFSLLAITPRGGDGIVYLGPLDRNGEYSWPSGGVYAVPLQVYGDIYRH